MPLETSVSEAMPLVVLTTSACGARNGRTVERMAAGPRTFASMFEESAEWERERGVEFRSVRMPALLRRWVIFLEPRMVGRWVERDAVESGDVMSHLRIWKDGCWRPRSSSSGEIVRTSVMSVVSGCAEIWRASSRPIPRLAPVRR